MPIITMPDGVNVDFPDDMPIEQIIQKIASKFPDAVNNPQPKNDTSFSITDALSDKSPAMQDIGRFSDVGRRAALEGFTGLANLPVAGMNLANYAEEKITGRSTGHIPYPSELMGNLIDSADNGNSRPKTNTEKLYSAVLGALSSVGGNVLTGLGAKVTSHPELAKILTDKLLNQMRSSIGGALGSEVASELGGGQVSQIVAGILGGGVSSMKRPRANATADIENQIMTRSDRSNLLNKAESAFQQSKVAEIPITLGEALDNTKMMQKTGQLVNNDKIALQANSFYDTRQDFMPEKMHELASNYGSATDLQGSVNNLNDLTDKAAGEITKKLSKTAEPLYEEAMQKSLPPNHPILKDPVVQYYIDKARKDISFSEATVENMDNSLPVLDAAKKLMDKDINSKLDPNAPANTSQIIKTKTKLLNSIDTYLQNSKGTNPYKQARDVYVQGQSELDARKTLGALSEIDLTAPSKTVNALKAMGSDATYKVTNALKGDSPVIAQTMIFDALENKSALQIPKQQVNKFKMILGNKYDKFNDTMETIARAQKGQDLRESLGGTLHKKQVLDTLAEVPTSRSGGLNALKKSVEWVTGRNSDRYMKRYAEVMFTDEGQKLVQRLKDVKSWDEQQKILTKLNGYLKKNVGRFGVSVSGINFDNNENNP